MDGSNQIRDIRGNIVRISIIKTGANTISTEASSHEYECSYHIATKKFILKYGARMPRRRMIVKIL